MATVERLSTLPVNGVLRDCPPHVVILGSGASRACVPKGDRNGQTLPVMADFIETLGLGTLLRSHGLAAADGNFEEIYSDLHERGHPALAELEEDVQAYFSELRLPDAPTIYDQLVVSLRSKDLIATFNWDPLLMQAYLRAPFPIGAKPGIAFLHGCVAVGVCLACPAGGLMENEVCSKCGKPFRRSRLLYPIRKKNYSADPFIADQWRVATDALRRAYMVTIMGYGAPTSDVEAVGLMHLASSEADPMMRQQRQFEVVDIAPRKALESRWAPFFTRDHYAIHDRLAYSRILRYPRRSCEGLMAALLWLNPWPEKPLRLPATRDELYAQVVSLVKQDST